jgi:RNA polymerase sigma-70 factor (ECF subfamily)
MKLLLAFGRRIGRDDGTLPRRHRITPSEPERDGIILTDDDAALLARIHAGDTTAFRELIDQYGNGALRVAYRILHSRDAARDALQNVLSDWWVRRAELAPRPSLRAYLFTAVRYQALSELRRSTIRTGVRPLVGVVPHGPVDPDTLPAQSDEPALDGRLTVDALLARLPERRRLVVQLRYLEQLSYAEIARIMGISAKAVEHLVLRSLEALRQAL